MAGFRPGFGRGGITHSLLVMEHLGGPEAASATAAMALDWMAEVVAGLMAICVAVVVVEVGVDTQEPGDAAEGGDEAAETGVIESCPGLGLMLAPDGAGEIADAVAILIRFRYGVTGGCHRLAPIRRWRLCSCV